MAARKGNATGNPEATKQTEKMIENFNRRSKKTGPEASPEALQDEPERAQDTAPAPEPESVSQPDKVEPQNKATDPLSSSYGPKSLNASARGLMNKKDNRSHRISIFVTEGRYQALQALKKATGVSVNSFINAAIDNILEDNKEFLPDEKF